MGAVEDRRGYGGRDEPNQNEQAARDAGLGFGVAVGSEDLVDQRRGGVEEADVDAEGDEDEVEGKVWKEGLETLGEGSFGERG